MADGRGQMRRRPGSRLWLSAGWLGLSGAAAALLGALDRAARPLAQDLFLGRLPPFWVAGAEPGFYLGTDSLGRDVLEPHHLHGARVALMVALVAGTLTCVIGRRVWACWRGSCAAGWIW